MTEQPHAIQYLDAVEEALCFGWVDGVKKKISPNELAQRLSTRQKKSNWTELNKETVLDFLIHVVFTHWPNLIPDIRQRAHKNVSILVFSPNDGHHARMIREMIHYQMDSQLTIDLFSGNHLSIEKL